MHVLERHLAADEIGREIAIPFGVPVLDEGHLAGRAGIADHPVETVALVAAHLGEHGDELALAATELDHPLAVQVEALDQVACEALVEGVEGRRRRLGGFVVVLVAHARGIEGAVPDEAAARAEAHADVAPRAIQSLRARAHQLDLMHRDAVHLVERALGGGAARGADVRAGGAIAHVVRLSCWPACGSRTACRHTMRGRRNWDDEAAAPGAVFGLLLQDLVQRNSRSAAACRPAGRASSCSTGRISSLLPGM